MTTIGFLTIGQSPRPDILDSMFGSSPAWARQYGALDELSPAEIVALEPTAGEHPLVTRLRSGEEVTVAKERLLPYLQRAADDAVRSGAALLVVLCTGTFSNLHAPVPILYPDRILVNTVNALLPEGTLGVVMPHPGQYEAMQRKWALPGRRFVGASASPYTGGAELARIAGTLAEEGVDLIVLDCMGFTRAMKRKMAETSGRPVVLANRLVGRLIEELIDAEISSPVTA